MKHLEPDRATEHTPEEKVVQGFNTLRIKDALDAVLQAMPVASVPCAATTKECQPAVAEPGITESLGNLKKIK
jgi:hypothetical protein